MRSVLPVESRNEIDRVAPMEIALQNGKWENGKWEMRSIESRQSKLHCKWEMGNEIDRVVVTGDLRSIESRPVEIAVQNGNGK